MYRWVVLFYLQYLRISPSECQQCSHTQLIQPGQEFKVNNPAFPNPYPAETRCSWEAYTVPGLLVEISCGRVQLAKNSKGGCLDNLMIVMNNDATSYCAPFNVSGNRVEMRLTATTRWSGYFNCIFKVPRRSIAPPTTATAATAPPATAPPAASPPPVVTPPDSLEELPPLDPSDTNLQPQGSGGLGDCDCGWNQKAPRVRIVGGEEAQIHEFPSMVAFVNRNTRSMWCGATIIAPTAVLTAAHCTVGRDPADYALLLGEHDTSQGSEAETSLVRVAKFINHAEYNARTQANDVALATTDQPLTFMQNVGPACLPYNFQSSVNQYLTVAGWGLDSFGGALSNVLMKVDIKVVRPEYCSRTYDEYNTEKHICTYERGKDACQYDSGGPLYAYNSENKQFVMGVVSYGRDCGKKDPAVNSNVTSYIDWIQAQLPDEIFCRRNA